MTKKKKNLILRAQEATSFQFLQLNVTQIHVMEGLYIS